MNDQPEANPTSIIPAPPELTLPLVPRIAPSARSDNNVVDADWVQRYPARRRASWLRWVGLVLRLMVGGGLAWFFYGLPVEGFPNYVQNWKNPIIIFGLVCFIGKSMLDTFFYDHFQF